jgi:ketosteroid isomerase-like protein
MSSAEGVELPLPALLDAFNAHDVGKQQVRKGFQARFDGIPDIDYGDDRHWTCGDRGVSGWTIRGTTATGESIEVRGCDLFEFTDGKISRKDSFWKIVD